MDELKILIQAILSLKDVNKSKQQILSELPKLEQQLQSDKKARINIIAGLDIPKSKSLIQSQLNTLSSQAKIPTIKVGVNVGSIVTSDIKEVSSVSKTVSDAMVKNFKNSFGITKKLSQEAKIEIKSALQDISNAWNSGDIDKYSISIQKIMDLAGQNGIKIISPETQNAIQELKNFLSDGSKVYIGEKLRQDLQYSLGSAKEVKSVLSTVYGTGKWTFDQAKGGSQADTVANPDYITQYNGLSEAIIKVYNSIKTLQSASSGTVFDNTSTQMARNEIEDLIRSILKLNNETSKLTYISGIGVFENINEAISEAQINIDPEKEKQLNEYLEKQVKLTNEILDTRTKIVKIRDDPNKSSELDTQNSILSKKGEELTLLRKENSEMTEIMSMEKQREYILEHTGKSHERLQVAQAQAADKLAKAEEKVAQQSEKTLATEIKKSAQLDRQIDTLKAQIETYKTSNPKSVKYYDKEFNSLIQSLDSAETKEDLAKVRAEFTTLKSEIKAAGQEGKTFWQTIKDSAEKFSSWMTLTSIISAAARDIKKMVDNVIELDSAMTNLKKVTDETDNTYIRFFKNTAQQAKELKIGLSDLINQTAEWAKKGYDISDSSIASKASGIYSIVGEVDNSTAVQDLTTVIKSYNMAIEDSIDIVDKFNNISNKYSVNAADIGQMLSNSVSSLSVAGNSLDQAIAMGTTITEITGDASEAGKMIARAV